MQDAALAACLTATAAASILAACALRCCVLLLKEEVPAADTATTKFEIAIDSDSEASNSDEEVYVRVKEPPEPLRVRLVQHESEI